MWGASARAHVNASFARWCLHARLSIADQGVILVLKILSLKNRFGKFWNFDPWWPQFWPKPKNDRNDFEMIFRELPNTTFRFSLRRPGAENMGSFKRPPPSRRWKIQRPSRARVKRFSPERRLTSGAAPCHFWGRHSEFRFPHIKERDCVFRDKFRETRINYPSYMSKVNAHYERIDPQTEWETPLAVAVVDPLRMHFDNAHYNRIDPRNGVSHSVSGSIRS